MRKPKCPKAPEGFAGVLSHYLAMAERARDKYKDIPSAQQTEFSVNQTAYWRNVASGIRWVLAEVGKQGKSTSKPEA